MLVELIRPTPRDMGDRNNTVGASEIGLCARQIWFRKNGQQPEREEPWGFQERGVVIEAWVMERLQGAPIEHVQEQRTDGFLSCTVDLMMGGEPVDIKSIDPRVSRLPKPAHVMQSQVQSGMWKAERGHLCYVNASDFQDIREFVVPADNYEALKQRARWIMTTNEQPPPEGRIAGGDECQHCLFQKACLGAPIEDKGRLTDAEREAIVTARDAVRRYEEMEEGAAKGAATYREQIRDILRAADVRRAPGLARVSRSARTVLDQKAMEADGIDLGKYRKPGRESESVTLE